ncbi:Hypothetical protein A7982_11146 [Minicystis rosea]|nr:Hypothetical protein A7982_11146 [Minicystis rosea]
MAEKTITACFDFEAVAEEALAELSPLNARGLAAFYEDGLT